MPSRSAEQARVIKTVSKARSPAASGTSGTNDLVDQYRRLADEETPGGLLSAGGAFVDFPGAVLLAGHNGIVLNANDLAEPIGQVLQSGQHEELRAAVQAALAGNAAQVSPLLAKAGPGPTAAARAFVELGRAPCTETVGT